MYTHLNDLLQYAYIHDACTALLTDSSLFYVIRPFFLSGPFKLYYIFLQQYMYEGMV